MPIDKEIALKKIEQIKMLLEELRSSISMNFEEFKSDIHIIRSAERSFQLLVDSAIDINGIIIIERSGKAPETYRQSFTALGELNILPTDLADALAKTASLRNILVHEYDFEEDYEKFYESARDCLPAYEKYYAFAFAYITR